MKVKDIWNVAMCPLYTKDGYVNAIELDFIKDCEVTRLSTYSEVGHNRVRGIYVEWELQDNN